MATKRRQWPHLPTQWSRMARVTETQSLIYLLQVLPLGMKCIFIWSVGVKSASGQCHYLSDIIDFMG